MEIYIIAAISFAVMFAYRYISEIMITVKLVADTHKIAQRPNLLYALSIVLFTLSFLIFPLYAIVVLFSSRQELIKSWARLILLKYYDLELKISS